MLFRFPNFCILLEIDEHSHSSRCELYEMSHLEVIRRWCLENKGLDKMFVLRVNPDGNKPMFSKYNSSNKESMWKPTEHFIPKFERICTDYLVPVVQLAMHGQAIDVAHMFEGSVQGTKVVKLFY